MRDTSLGSTIVSTVLKLGITLDRNIAETTAYLSQIHVEVFRFYVGIEHFFLQVRDNAYQNQEASI